MNIFIEGLLLFLPGGIANMTPVFANKVPGLNRWHTPMDFGLSAGGARIFGAHKTWRGFTTGVALGGLSAVALLPLTSFDGGIGYNLWLGVVMSVGVLLGDAIKSFFKRRVNVKPGGTWFPFDQLDYIVGGLLAILPFGFMTLKLAAAITFMYFFLVIMTTYVGFKLRLKDSPI